MFSKFLYNLFLILYGIGIRVASVWNPKAREWLNGRRNFFDKINSLLPAKNPQQDPAGEMVWMHCASLGEFEQGRPLLEQLRVNNPGQKIVLTFFSPSGYEVMKDYSGVDKVLYLPLDSAANAQKFINAVNPKLVLWVKYEFWFYYLTELKARNIPTILVSGIFRQNQPFFKSYGSIWKKMLETFTHFFVQNEESKSLLALLGYTQNVSNDGDTRFDRVLEIAANFVPVPHVAAFCGDNQVVVAGSTWEEDEIELLHFINVHQHIRFIIAPHEINKTNLKDVKDEFPNSIYYSELVEQETGAIQKEKQNNANVLIIDNIGMLSRLYNYATVAYVGGGFGADGVHNVLEAAVYGKPVVFGPVYEKFDEAIGLVSAGGAVSVEGPIPLEKALNKLLTNAEAGSSMGRLAKEYVYAHAGASQKIIRFIQEKRLLTS